MTRECVGIFVDYSMPSEYVVTMLDVVASERGYPESPRVDNGPECTGADFREWAGDHGVPLCYGGPGMPTDNAHIESLNDRFREECVKRGEFTTLGEVGVIGTTPVVRTAARITGLPRRMPPSWRRA